MVLHAAQVNQQQLKEILNLSTRPSPDKERDEARQPATIMAFTGVSEGDRILDLSAGGGWYSELFSHAVGPKGKVYAQNDQLMWRFAEKSMTERTSNGRLANIERLDNVAVTDIKLPANSIDIAFMALSYHDLFFTSKLQNGKKVTLRDEVVDYQAALAQLKTLLNDAGVVIIIDHTAKAGSGYEAANTVHRIDPSIRGKTDRFIYKFIKQ